MSESQVFYPEKAPESESLRTVAQLAEHIPALYEDYVENIKLLREKDPTATFLGVDYDEETGALSVTSDVINVAEGYEPYSVTWKNQTFPVRYESNTQLTITPFKRPGKAILARTLYELSLSSVNLTRTVFFTDEKTHAQSEVQNERDWNYLTMVLDPLKRKEVDIRRPGSIHSPEYPHSKDQIKQAGKVIAASFPDTRPKSKR